MLFNEIKLWPPNDIDIIHVDRIEIIQQILFLNNIFNENNLDYCVVGGTLLGAIRHQGFMPWDDDVDYLMEVENIKKIIELKILEKNNFSVEVLGSNVKNGNIIKAWKKNIHYDIWPFSIQEKNISTHVGDFLINKTFPFRLVKFEDYTIKVPNDPKYYLDATIPDWDKIIKIKYLKDNWILMVKRGVVDNPIFQIIDIV
jgi:phosphorylcholine metabolism protein LicD